MNQIRMNVYGVSIEHPVDWQIYINSQNKFSFNEGLIKIDKVDGEKKNQISLTIRWAKMKKDINLEDYIEELEKQFRKKEKKSRHKDSYKIMDKKRWMIDGKEAYFLHNQFQANHNVYRFLGKDELVETLQIVYYSKETKRMIIGTLLTTPEELRVSKTELMNILSSLREDIQGDIEYLKKGQDSSQIKAI